MPPSYLPHLTGEEGYTDRCTRIRNKERRKTNMKVLVSPQHSFVKGSQTPLTPKNRFLMRRCLLITPLSVRSAFTSGRSRSADSTCIHVVLPPPSPARPYVRSPILLYARLLDTDSIKSLSSMPKPSLCSFSVTATDRQQLKTNSEVVVKVGGRGGLRR